MTSSSPRRPLALPYGAPLRALFPLDPQVTYLNHGAFGVTPLEVLGEQAHWRDLIERNPTAFMVRILPAALRQAAAELAAHLGVLADQLVFVDNATTGCNAVLRSLDLGPGDEILITNLSYKAIANAARFVARRSGARLVTAQVPFPLPSRQSLLAAVAAALSPRTRLAIFDHVASQTALVMPVAELSLMARQAGAVVLIDGAHAPGQLPLMLSETGADWYVGNCHKWLMAPRACGFLWVSPGARPPIHPLAISVGYEAGLAAEFDWTGTRDPSSFLSVPAAISFHRDLGGAELMARNAALARQAGQMLAGAWGTELGGPPEQFQAMVSVRMALSAPADEQRALRLRRWLAETHSIEVELFAQADALWVRVAAQAYNEIADYQRLAGVLMGDQIEHA